MPFAAFADNAIVCPACGGSVTKQELRLLASHSDFYKCSKCGKWAYLNAPGGLKLFSVGDQQILDAADANAILNFAFNNGHLIPAKKAPSGIGRKDLPGYADDNGTANYNSSGVLQVVVNPIGFHWDNSSYKGSKFGLSLPVSVDVSGSQFGLTSNPKWALYAIYEFVAPCDGIFYLGREACGQTVFTSSLFYNSSWYTQNYNIPNYDGYGLSVSASKGQTLYYVSGALVCSIDGYQRTGASAVCTNFGLLLTLHGKRVREVPLVAVTAISCLPFSCISFLCAVLARRFFGVKVKGRGGDFFSTDAAEQVCAEKILPRPLLLYQKK